MEEKGFDLKAFELKESLIKTINGTDLPITAKWSVINELYAELNQLKIQAIQMQKKAYEESTVSKEGE